MTTDGQMEQAPTLAPRERFINKIRQKATKNPDIQYTTSPHFIVVYEEGPRTFGHDRVWLDTDPHSLTDFLETSLRRASERFQINVPTTQVVEVGKKPLFSSTGSGHYSGKKDGLGFNRVYINEKEIRNNSHFPQIYRIAAHEAIGHGYMFDALLPDYKKDAGRYIFGFIVEGLAKFLELEAVGEDPDGPFIDSLRNKGTTEDSFSLRKIVRPFVSDGPMMDLGPTHQDYIRGASFMGFVFQAYGVDKLKEWLKNPDLKHSADMLSQTLGLSLDEIEGEWKNKVMQKLYHNS